MHAVTTPRALALALLKNLPAKKRLNRLPRTAQAGRAKRHLLANPAKPRLLAFNIHGITKGCATRIYKLMRDLIGGNPSTSHSIPPNAPCNILILLIVFFDFWAVR